MALARITGLLSLFFALTLCGGESSPPTPTPGPFDARLLEIAGTYLKFHRVDDQIHLAPTMCAMVNFSIPRLSASTDEKTHGKKLYYLFAKHRDEYWDAPKQASQPIGQVVVKEAWHADETTQTKFKDPHSQLEGKSFAHEGKFLAPGEKKGLYIMLKMDPKTDGTDQGWVYGTVTPDGKTVTSAGRVASCMKCHEEAKFDRLFGVADKSNAANLRGAR